MEDKEKIGALLELYKIQMDHFEKTRNIEFKVNIAFWTLIVLIGQFCYGKIILDPSSLGWYLIIAVTVLVIHFSWMKLIQGSEDKSLSFARDQYRSIIHAILKSQDPKQDFFKNLVDKPTEEIKGWNWIKCEVGVTFILLVGLVIFLWSPPQKCHVKEFSKVHCDYQDLDN